MNWKKLEKLIVRAILMGNPGAGNKELAKLLREQSL